MDDEGRIGTCFDAAGLVERFATSPLGLDNARKLPELVRACTHRDADVGFGVRIESSA